MATRTTEEVLKKMGLRIQELRRQRGHTQESLAAELNMLPPNYARIEQGRSNVTVDTLVRITNALDVGLAEVFVDPTVPAPKPGRPQKARP